MSDWDPEKYLQFRRQRTQPAVDLVRRLDGLNPRGVVDIGCGPGNSTAVLREAFPQAELLGIDSSETMIEKARREHGELSFVRRSAQELTGSYDLLFSNACLQWIPDHPALLPKLMGNLTDEGALAVQIPMNQEEPLFRVIREVAAESRWDFSRVLFEHNDVLRPAEYFDILSGCASALDQWETVYYHALPSHRHLIEWVRGSRLRPYLDALDEKDGAAFEQAILERAEAAYPLTVSGEVLLRFRRFFFIARR